MLNRAFVILVCADLWPGFARDHALSGSQMRIITGPRIDLAIALIDRMKNYLQVAVIPYIRY